MSKKPPSDLQKIVSARLRAIQKEMHLSDSGMADRLKIGRSRWSNWIGIENSNMPEERVLIDLCEMTGLTLDWIYRGKLAGLPLALAIRLEARVAGLDPDGTNEDLSPVAGRVALAVMERA